VNPNTEGQVAQTGSSTQLLVEGGERGRFVGGGPYRTVSPATKSSAKRRLL
jgi:hypothetical protein